VAQEETHDHKVDVEDLLVRPGTYFNPQTEVVVIVVDDVSIDQEIFNMEPYEGADWVRISDDVPVDSDGLDTTLQRFQTDHVDLDEMTPAKFERDEDDVDEDGDGDDEELDEDEALAPQAGGEEQSE
jgi:hypothetical protein